MGLSIIDAVTVILYLVGMLLLGAFFRKYVHSSRDYFLAARALPFWAIGMSLVVTDIGAVDFVGVAGQAYRFGIAVANFDWLGTIPGMLIAAFIFIPYYWRAGVYTIPEYLERRYNVAVRTLEAGVWVLFIALDLGIMFWASALLLHTLMGWPIAFSILITAFVVGVYTVSGGLSAVVMTDVIQLVIMYVGGFAVIALGLHEVGGWSGLVDKIHGLGPQYERHFQMFLPPDAGTPYPWTGILFGLTFVLANAYWIGNQTIVQRALGAQDEWHAKASMIFGSLLKLFIPVLVVTPGLIALALFPEIGDGDQAFPMLIHRLLPPGLTGLVFAGFLAALMSSVDSALNSAATLFTKDIYERFLVRKASDKHYLRVGRLTTLVILLVGVISAPLTQQFPGMYVYVQTLLSIIQGPTLAILVLGMFWKRATAAGGTAGLLTGIATSTLLFAFRSGLFSISDPFLYISWWSFLVSLLVTAGVSLFTEPHPQERLRGLVYQLTADEEVQLALRRRIAGA
jgi:SSS family solute:Na+ symporter